MNSNPMIKKGLSQSTDFSQEVMSVKGTRNKTLTLVGLTSIVAVCMYILTSYQFTMTGDWTLSTGLSGVSAILGFILVLMMVFRPKSARTFSTLYALVEGVFVGAISTRFSYYFDGVVPKALTLTLLAVVFTLLLYKESPSLAGKIRRGVIILTFTIFAISILGLLFQMFGVPFILFGSGPIGIVFSIFTTIVAIANLMIDYDNIIIGARSGLPKYMEHFFAASILITIVWVYVEMLQLLAKIAQSSSE
ncbi:hypothetical protein AN639_12925 [Candidatus Epulonipiscium fishelsonii]|uniref:Uncharacterized protein n=1 Tax=Candidatus Epulonipiscium fishelsonii TaxID=77094 RepID=A0ACC8XDV8_9FIRM|nr:hypothetical protein AN396_04880 [Epulopiscium sp. SCG-B11WGA-EpuloA1]ONI42163.1 hypothetical protein AN639_12925 [Epulopiscium sp. SCG-B05WGA-EpuloA1]